MLSPLTVNQKSCIRCGRCIRVCPSSIFSKSGLDSEINLKHEGYCLHCGHCVIACPTNSILHKTYPKGKVHSIKQEDLPSPDAVMLLCYTRRSIRDFSSNSVPVQYLKLILNAAHTAPTASNRQQRKYVCITNLNTLNEISSYAIKLLEKSVRPLNNPFLKPILRRIMPYNYIELHRLERVFRKYHNNHDPILYNAVALILIYSLKNTSTFNLRKSREKLFQSPGLDIFYNKINYRPFDSRYIFYNGNIVERPLLRVMRHFIQGENMGMIVGRQGQVVGNMPWNLIFTTNCITDFNLYYRGGGATFPLYLYPDPNNPDIFSEAKRTPNLDMKIVEDIEAGLKLKFTAEETDEENTFAPIHLLDYIYAVLHSPQYRETYKEFLKTDFPRVPYPKNAYKFWQLVVIGKQIRKLHLLDTKGTAGVSYPNDGSNEVTRRIVQTDFEITGKNKTMGRVWINDEQYFDNIPVIAWEFYIGGYQPAQKWLKDRRGRTLSYDDLEHYKNIVHALTHTHRLMKEVDKVGVV